MSFQEADVPDQTKLAIDACLQNAEHLLIACKAARGPGRNHIAYHLAALALEEVGKASMIAVSVLRRISPTETTETDEEERRPVDGIEDHERKLFWALWLPTLTGHKVTIAEFREAHALANQIHALRLATLYVNPDQLAFPQEISNEELDALISTSEARLNLERAKGFQTPDESTQLDLDWFFQVTGNKELQMIVLGETSLAKLTEFGGDGRRWVEWLRNTIDEVNRNNRQLAENALLGKEAKEAEGSEPKWQIKVRLKSWSHSIRPKPLAAWNQHSKWIKLFPTADKKELIVQFALGKNCSVHSVWPAGMQYCGMFVISLNIGALGYFWWYKPEFVSKFYEEILDLENKASVSLDRNPPLVVSLGHQALKDQELANVSLVFVHLAQVNDAQKKAYDTYFRAVGLLAKNDIFGQFEHVVIAEFYESFRLGLLGYGDWDAATGNLTTAAEKLFNETRVGPEFIAELLKILDLAGEVGRTKSPKQPVTLEEVAKMKAFCDVYFLLRAKKKIKRSATGYIPPRQ